ncbi:unnamed protein product [Brassica rapa]|uniref:B box-type domain-containing protein n=1 Tax=Brassica campestris TaxID=3711 RepID=A0A3P6CTU9_BRACM|nr:unnamed protein product [Brassica rapa]VDD17018.1 unnamed protein product [Brassica rapa]
MAASSGVETEPEWIKRVRSEGAVPCLKPDSKDCKNSWTTPSPNTFMVRGPHYFSDKVKVPAGDFLLKPLGFDWVKGPTKLSEILSYPSSRIRKAIDEQFQTEDATAKPFVWAFNLQLPHKDNYSAVAYFVSTEPILQGSLMDQFLKGDDGFKKSRLKLIANIVKGPWIVRKAVGEQAICVIGRALSCKYVSGENFVEIDVDIGSSMVASAIVHLAFGYITTLTVDLAFLIESQTDAELPEKLLGAVRFSELQTDSAVSMELSSSTSNERSSWWKSLGNGFSNLLNQDTPNMNNTSFGNLQRDEDVKKPTVCGKKEKKMKIQCDVCENAPATVICCADEAALCPKCDVEIHAANKLASKHQRLHLNSLSTKFPRCDICQEKAAFIFCVEDRALLCRDCDESIHVANSRSANHQRFLATGIKVALSSSSCSKETDKNHQSEPSNNQQKAKEIPSQQQPSSASPLPWAVDDFFHFSDPEFTDKKGQLDLGELEWFSDMGFFSDQINQETLPAAQVPELSVAHLGHVHSYRPMKSNASYKKPRLEIRVDDEDDEEEHFIVPDLG